MAWYDPLGRLQTLTQSGGTAQTKRVDLTYNAVGQYQSIVRSVTGPSNPVATTTFTYEASTGRLSGMNHTGPSGNLIRSYGYQYDLADRLTSITDTFAGPSSFGYDVTNQLVSAAHTNQPGESFTYDLNGNRQNPGYTTGQYNRITNDGVYSYEYDAEGNRTKRTKLSNGEYEEYTWDHRNRLIQVVKKSAGGAILNTVTEAYDPLDRRIKEETTQWGFTNAVWFAYDGGHVALRFDGNGSLTGRYLHGEAVDQLFAEEVGGQTRWTLTDHLGSVRDVLGDTGMTLGRITYDSFGQATNTTGIVDTLFRYTARPGMSATGLYDYRARTYDPRIGQFLSEDPIAFTAGDPNLRRYVGNEPTRYTDPSGLAQDRPKTAYFVQGDPADVDASWWDSPPRFQSGSQRFFADAGGDAIKLVLAAATLLDELRWKARRAVLATEIGHAECIGGPLSTATIWIPDWEAVDQIIEEEKQGIYREPIHGTVPIGPRLPIKGVIIRSAPRIGGGMLPRAGGGAPAAARTGPLFQNPSQIVTTRVGELRAAIPTAQQGRITMAAAVVEDSNGVRSVLVSSSEPRGLRPGVTLQPGEILVRGTGHAEANIIAHAEANNLRVINIGATRSVCPACQDVINPTGANISTPLRPRPGN